ncbi:MAG: GIY-YIG nuclease family protein [Flavobacteriaceae bacterium]
MEIIDLKKFDENFKKILEEIQSEVDKINLDEMPLCEFKLSEYEKLDTFSSTTKEGIYIFYIQKKSLDKFKENWNSAKIEKASPTIMNGRIESYEEKEEEWIPLYIGKSKTIKKRITEHITLKKESTTSSMKLQERKEFENDMFAVRIIPLKTDYYDIIAHYIESVLRDKIKPIVGKK